MTDRMNILFITANRLGDAVLSTGVLASLVDSYPDAEFTIACGPYAAGIFRTVPRLKRLVILRKKSWNWHWIDLLRECLCTRWDLIIDLRNSLASRLLMSKRRATKGGSTGKHKVIENAAILGLATPTAPRIWTDEAAEDAASKLLPEGRRLLALGPAANWPPKQWPIEKFASLATILTGDDGLLSGAAVLVVADKSERGQIVPLLEAISSDRRVELIGAELAIVAACLKRSSLFVGNDSGLMHLAAAVGTPTLGLFGPGYEHIYGPWGPQAAFVRTLENREELLARLPNLAAREPNLMQSLTVEKVAAAARELLRPR